MQQTSEKAITMTKQKGYKGLYQDNVGENGQNMKDTQNIESLRFLVDDQII